MQISPEKIKYFRKDNGWSQEVLAKASGLSLRTIQRVEKDGNASSETQLALAAALNKTTKELFHTSEQIEVFWKWRNIMQNLIAILIVAGAIIMLLMLGGDLGMFADFYGALFLLLFMYACSVIAFGSHGLVKSISGLKYLFSSEVTPTSNTKHLTYIYKKQISFIYAGALIAFAVGSVSILSNQASITSVAHFNAAWAVNILIVFYAAVAAEGVLRPLTAKLESAKLTVELTQNSDE
ncbi:helix-turn-helix transcriptional regulator [Thalassotalea sp. M1531]|uniref:Helix-turn-helix transcriptional regulator n=1 Tax=Thalassotalea algicola TaxID=2716224 RepID=A0A7Y0Q8S6_9GAMM|nr:helix-turn-helix transcriptional regulator [Thalassotalea algicola]NMP33546.1 helix-turn-helix transcriptional regulator [Thalassotalea algicola]